ncbi:MAG: hypothetical protein ABI002_09740 [Saprospiraceae bacterium]
MRGCLGQLFLIGIIALIVVGVALKDSIESYWRANDITAIAADKDAAVFDANIADYADQKWDSGATRSQAVRKIVVVNVATKKRDDLNSSFPEAMRAGKHQEVDAIVLIRRGEERAGSYSDGSSAIRRTASISVFHSNGDTLCATKEFKGSEPPQSKRGRGSTAYGAEPSEAIMSYIKSCIGNTK